MRQERQGEDDLESDLQDQLESSGRTRIVPPEGLVGAHLERRESASHGLEEPVGAGADVAPTRKAEARERERHRLQRELPAEDRSGFEHAAAEADRLVAERRLTAEATPARWADRSWLWLRAHPLHVAGAAAGLLVVAVGSYLALRE
jgi:hypothetical protein